MKKLLLIFLAGALFISCSTQNTETKELTEEEIVSKAEQIHKDVMTLDTHIDINVRNFTDSINYTQDLDNQVTLPKMEKGGLDVAWFVVFAGQDEHTEEGYANAYKNAMAKFDAIHRLAEEIAPDRIGLATSSEEARKIHAEGKKVAMIGIENGYPVGTDISNVKKFYDLGGRYMSLSHNGHSQLCDSNTGEEDSVWLHNGLSELGKEVIAEMNKWGMMIDISHPSKEAIRQMVELSKAPIIASHSSARALSDHSRNLDDEQLEWMKKNGGVVQAVALGLYVNREKTEARRGAMNDIRNNIVDSLGVKWYTWREFRGLSEDEQNAFIAVYRKVNAMADEKANSMPNFPADVNVADFIDHIDYLVDKLGIDHVGISSDFDGGGGVEGWRDASQTYNVTLELVRRGYTEEEIEKLWSGNLLRVLDEVTKVAEELQAAG